jgi:hypothetical protein
MKKKHHLRQNVSQTVFGYAAACRGLILASLLALAACATHQPSQSSEDRFEKADENRDKKLSRGEASDYLVSQIFDSRDSNHDARMTLQEWSGGDPGRAADFKKRDANRDGIVTIDEAIRYGRAHGMANQMVREADKNGDGALDKAEMEAYGASRAGPSN